ncbi:MAG: CPBP family intramembrane metalloprotease [Gordonia sp. (in: high G+C Gram-positive bacteria)]|uniref:CPBP family intramembrane glutamic endopeptidase n=1 Tax=Gordonia sp. (in: high G+C Gram-positive bacteria) TaxID=84139 RepID=UPI0039E28EA6
MTAPEISADRVRPEPRPWWQLLVGIGIFVVAQVTSGFMVGLFCLGASAREVGIEKMACTFKAGAPGVATGLDVGLAMAALISVAGFLALIPLLTGRRAYELRGPRAAREFGLGLVLGAFPIVLAVAVLGALGNYRITDVSLGRGIISGLLIGIGAAFTEEIFFRGFLLRLLDKRVGALWATAIVSVIFGFIHITNPGAGLRGALSIVVAAGPLLCGAYFLTRRLWLAIGIHLAWNATMSAVFGIDVSGTGSGRGLFAAELSGPTWLSGGSMGIEGSVVLIVIGTALGVFLMAAAHRRGDLLPRRTAEPVG